MEDPELYVLPIRAWLIPRTISLLLPLLCLRAFYFETIQWVLKEHLMRGDQTVTSHKKTAL